MLLSFIYDGKKIPLVQLHADENQQQNIFSADSMTLLVGPNGSGKTRAMEKIASFFSKHKPSEDEISDFTWHHPDDKDTTHVIYYSTTPFGVKIPESSSRFYKINPENLKTKKPFHNATLHDLESEFKLTIKQKLRLNYLGPSQLSNIFNKAITNMKYGRKKIKDTWFIELYDEYKNNQENYNNEEYASRDDYYKQKFLALAKENIGNDFLLKLRAYSYARANHKNTENSEPQLLTKLGFTLQDFNLKQWGVASKTFDKTLHTLRRISEIVEDHRLEKNEYELSREMSESLANIKISPLGDIHYTEFSSGAAALLDQFSKIKNQINQICRSSKKNSLIVLIDEGDSFLHIGWQQKYIDHLDSLIASFKGKFKCMQVIIATHSAILMSDFPRQNIFILGQETKPKSAFDIHTPPSPTASFCAPIASIIHHAGNVGTISAFAERIIRDIIKKIENNDHDPKIIEMIDDPIIKSHLRKISNKKKGQDKDAY